MSSYDFTALTLCAVSTRARTFNRVALFKQAADFVQSFGGEVEFVSGKKGYVSLARVRKRLDSLLERGSGFDLKGGRAPFRTRFEMDDWLFAASLSETQFVLSKVLLGDAAQVQDAMMKLAAELPDLYAAHLRERRCDRGPVLAELGIAIGLSANDISEGLALSRWLNAYQDRSWEPYLRDVYEVNIFSSDALRQISVGDRTLEGFIENSALGATRLIGSDRVVWRLTEPDRLAARERLLKQGALIVGHAAGTLSQRGVDHDAVFETV